MVTVSFLDEGHPEKPFAFVQWKGTDVCLDFHCPCGAHGHFDGYFAYYLSCEECGRVWELPCYLTPRERVAADAAPDPVPLETWAHDGDLRRPS